MRLIDADALGLDINRKANENFPANRNLTLYAESLLAHAPTINAVPVVHGRWEKEPPYTSVGGEYKKALICSRCHSFFVSDGNTPWQMYNYCPNCGARMDGE